MPPWRRTVSDSAFPAKASRPCPPRQQHGARHATRSTLEAGCNDLRPQITTSWRYVMKARTGLTLLLLLLGNLTARAQTALGELEGRPAPVARRQCIAGANAGSLCNENADCPGSTCVDRNIFNISVAIHFNASGAQLTTIRNAITAGSAILFDITDGQAQIGQAVMHNNAFGTT